MKSAHSPLNRDNLTQPIHMQSFIKTRYFFWTLLKSARQHLYHIYSSLWRELRWKKSLLVKCKSLGLVIDKLLAHDKYSVLNKDKLLQPIHMQLSKKEKAFPRYFSAFLKSKLNFEHFQKQDKRQRWCISQITESEKPG